MTHKELILILDFGGQYTQIIARKVRECGVYAEILPFNATVQTVTSMHPKGIILSGSPWSVYDAIAPHADKEIFNLGIPMLGICYGLQDMAWALGGDVEKSAKREFGRARVEIVKENLLLSTHSPAAGPKSKIFNLQSSIVAWMSHGDSLKKLPPGFEIIAKSENAPIAAIANPVKKIYGVQFHPEVHHTPNGKEILSNFLFAICECVGGWTAESIIEASIRDIKERVGNANVICGLSGGVDSTVVAALIAKAIGKQLKCIHIDNGLMRKDESRAVVELFRSHYDVDFDFVDASDLFLTKLKGVTDPEKKRKIIGATFIEVFEPEAKKFAGATFLAQGTLYPDVIESVSFKGPSVTIKSHHNVGGLPEKMNLKLLEPFRELFKDEVRAVGRALGVPEELVKRHPFPGPGLGVRVLGEITRERCDILREADAIYIEEITKAGLYDEIWQAFAVLLPVQSVGVMGDERTYENVVALRAVTSVDGMTADWYRFPQEVLAVISNRIINEVRGVNRVAYDISSKPPATIEWE